MIRVVAAAVFFALSIVVGAGAQPVDDKGRYVCQNRVVIDTKSGRPANVKNLRRNTTTRIQRISAQIRALRGSSAPIKRQRARLTAQRLTLRAFLTNIKSCENGTLVTPTPTPPAATPTPAGPTPTPTLTPTPGVLRPHISAGFDHTCTTSATGTVRCFGDNNSQQIGVGSSPAVVQTPVVPAGLVGTPIVSVDAGTVHTCAAPASGGVLCWGSNLNGQVTGDTDLTPRGTPVPVTGVTGPFVQVVTGDRHSCGVQPSGGVVCWGQNNSGESGNGSTSTTALPGNVVGLATTVTKIATFFRHTCAVLGNGSVQCWGLNAQGQHGLGGSDFTIGTQARTPNNLRPNVSIVDVATGSDHTCVVYNDGIVQCVGQNDVGQMGVGTTSNQQMTWVTPSVSGVTGISAGDDFTCAIVNSGQGVSCWGRGTNGQLGNGSSSNSLTPVVVQGIVGTVVHVTTGRRFACALNSLGSVFCWGENASNQFGFTNPPTNTAVEVTGLNLNG